MEQIRVAIAIAFEDSRGTRILFWNIGHSWGEFCRIGDADIGNFYIL